MIENYTFTLEKREKVAKGIEHFYFSCPEFSYKAGNYVSLKNNAGRKPFTISSSPNESLIRITIKKVGLTTTEMFTMNPGDTIEAFGPFGLSFDERFTDKAIIFITGGTGITPSLAFHNHIMLNNLSNRLKVFYSCATADEIIPTDAESVVTLTREEKEGYFHGRITKVFLEKHLTQEDLENSVFVVCGPVVMEKEFKQILSEMGAKDIYNGRRA
ncbi:MAG: hypothetical protein ACMXYK_03610 [Candidatus Woesearchaeota archaeon]